MKRGQMAGIIVIFILVAAIVALLFLTKKEEQSGKAIQMPETIVATPEPQEVVSKVIYTEPEPTQAPPAPTQAPAQDVCITSHSATTCHAARALAQKKCPRSYQCEQTKLGLAPEGCYVELRCQRGTSGVKPREDYPRETQPMPYEAGYYKYPPSS
jgi:type IV secretory pathway VirB10-like protein